jgi:uncharacterized membrane protein
MKKHFLTGLIILLPIALTIVIAIWLFDLLTQPFVGIVENLLVSFEEARGIDIRNHEVLVIVVSRIIVVIVLCVLIFFLGFFGRRFFFSSLLRWSEKLFIKIPIIKTIYTISHDVTKSLFAGGENTFKKTVLIPFPKPETHALGLVIGEPPAAIKKIAQSLNLAVFVPTSPHPISGYILMSSQKELIDVDLTTEETFRYLIACGLIDPKKSPQTTQAPSP